MNYSIIKRGALSLLGLSLASALLINCTPDKSEIDLGAAPDADFTIAPIAGKANTYLLTVTTPNTFHFRWDIGDGSDPRSGKAVDTAYYAEAGTYTIKLLTLAKGGYGTVSKTVTVASDDPNANMELKQKLAGAVSKTWVLEQPGGGALLVGPPSGNAWWTSGPGDVTGRPCLFNDEFTFGRDGSFVFDDKGDFRVDDESNAPWPTDIGFPISCINTSQLPAKYKPWGSGNFTYRILENGTKLRVVGLGAHLGLYKAGEEGTSAQPEPQITYEILELTNTKLVVRKMYSWGQWQFTFKAK